MAVVTLHRRPMPPEGLGDLNNLMAGGKFMPAPDLEAWAREVFTLDAGPLFDPEHIHLRDAELGFLWTNVENLRQGRRILGTAEVVQFKGGAWTKGRQELQMREWFGCVPDFVLTFDALWCAEAEDREFCALVDHELRHCAQALDEFGQRKFNRVTGAPIFAMRPHDVEEFTASVSRFGVQACGGDAVDLVIAAARPSEITDAQIAQACGRAVGKRKVA